MTLKYVLNHGKTKWQIHSLNFLTARHLSMRWWRTHYSSERIQTPRCHKLALADENIHTKAQHSSFTGLIRLPRCVINHRGR